MYNYLVKYLIISSQILIFLSVFMNSFLVYACHSEEEHILNNNPSMRVSCVEYLIYVY